MSSSTTNPNRYEPEGAPEGGGVNELRSYLMDELRRLANLVNMLADGQIEETFTVPNKLRNGMIRYADGTSWNPGAGRGVYVYKSGTGWVLLG